MWTLIRLLLEEQSDQGPYCLQIWLLKSEADEKADDNCCDWQFKGQGVPVPKIAPNNRDIQINISSLSRTMPKFEAHTCLKIWTRVLLLCLKTAGWMSDEQHSALSFFNHLILFFCLIYPLLSLSCLSLRHKMTHNGWRVIKQELKFPLCQ